MKKQATQLIHGNVNGPTMGTTALPPAQLECKQNPKDSSNAEEKGELLGTAARNANGAAEPQLKTACFLLSTINSHHKAQYSPHLH